MRTILAAFLGLTLVAAQLDAEERQIRIAVTVPATPAEVWALWTTDSGVRSFFAPGSHIDLKVDGAYEIFFEPAASAGARGADGMRLLAVEPERRLAFTWNAPATLAYVRAQRTVVSIELTPVGRKRTEVVLRHTGWGSGPEWDEAIAYFDRAWNGFVMPSFKYRVEHGPIRWNAIPTFAPIRDSSIERLTVATR